MINAFLQAVKPRNRTIDADLLKITDDPIPKKRVQSEPKYHAVFKKLKPGQRIACAPDESQPVSQALRKYLKDRDLLDKFDVRSVRHYPKDNRGGVWMIERTKPRSEA